MYTCLYTHGLRISLKAKTLKFGFPSKPHSCHVHILFDRYTCRASETTILKCIVGFTYHPSTIWIAVNDFN